MSAVSGRVELRLADGSRTGCIRLDPTLTPDYLTVVFVKTVPTRQGVGRALYQRALAYAQQAGYRGLASQVDQRTRAGEAFWATLRAQGVTHLLGPIETLTEFPE